MMNKVKLLFGFFVLMAFVSNVLQWDKVLCVSQEHVSVEDIHKINSCDDLHSVKSSCCESVEIETEDEIEHEHCPTKEDCGDCVDVLLLEQNTGLESTGSFQLPELNFTFYSSLLNVLSQSTKYDLCLAYDTKHSILFPQYAHKLSTVLLI